MTKKPTNWSPLVRHNCSQNVGLLYPLFDDVMALVDEGIAATDVVMRISSKLERNRNGSTGSLELLARLDREEASVLSCDLLNNCDCTTFPRSDLFDVRACQEIRPCTSDQ